MFWQLPSFPQINRPPASLQRQRLSSCSRTAPGPGGVPGDSQEGEGRATQACGCRHLSLLTNDDAQVLKAGQRVLLGVQHLLGRLLHVPMRLLGEHLAAAAATAVSGPLPARSRWRKVGEWAERRLA